MAHIALIRHFETDWNRQGRIQGRADQPLNADAAKTVAGKRLSREFADLIWYTSPLKRAIQTADLLGAPNPRHDDRLIEMDWGDWEGQRLTDLRGSLGEEMSNNEARGLDFRPTGGESPRDVCERVKPWLLEIADGDVAAVTHKGVIRAVLSLALDWDMTAKSPVRPDWKCAQVFAVSTAGKLSLVQANQAFLVSGDEPL